MAAALTFRVLDETPAGKALHELRLELRVASERLTAAELIERRVRAEVARHNAAPADHYAGLVQPADAERVLNGYRLRRVRAIDADEQVRLALESFSKNGFLLLVGDEQVDDPGFEIVVTPETTVRFVKLVPLVGG